MFVKSYNIEMM